MNEAKKVKKKFKKIAKQLKRGGANTELLNDSLVRMVQNLKRDHRDMVNLLSGKAKIEDMERCKSKEKRTRNTKMALIEKENQDANKRKGKNTKLEPLRDDMVFNRRFIDYSVTPKSKYLRDLLKNGVVDLNDKLQLKLTDPAYGNAEKYKDLIIEVTRKEAIFRINVVFLKECVVVAIKRLSDTHEYIFSFDMESKTITIPEDGTDIAPSAKYVIKSLMELPIYKSYSIDKKTGLWNKDSFYKTMSKILSHVESLPVDKLTVPNKTEPEKKEEN